MKKPILITLTLATTFLLGFAFKSVTTKNKENNMKRLSIDIPNELHHMLKVHTSYKECKIKDFVKKAIQSKIKLEQQVHISKNIPNADTIKIFEENLDMMSNEQIRSLAMKLKLDPSGAKPVLKKRLLQQFDTLKE